MSFLCHCKPTSLDEEEGWLRLGNLEGANISCQSTCLCWEVLKAWAEQGLNCPTSQCWVTRAAPDQYSFSTSVKVQGVLCACLGDGCSTFSRSEERVHLGQGTVPHSRQPLFGRVQCPHWPLYLFPWRVGTRHPVFCKCDWETISMVVRTCDATYLG